MLTIGTTSFSIDPYLTPCGGVSTAEGKPVEKSRTSMRSDNVGDNLTVTPAPPVTIILIEFALVKYPNWLSGW